MWECDDAHVYVPICIIAFQTLLRFSREFCTFVAGGEGIADVIFVPEQLKTNLQSLLWLCSHC